MTHHLRLADGRRMAWEEAGDPDGFPVVGCHGNPASRLTFRLPASRGDLTGVRLLTPDRPGTGESDPAPTGPRRMHAAWTEDLAQLLDHLGLPRCAVVGVSGGGPFALAAADHLRDRVTVLGLVSTGPVLEELVREAPLGARLFFRAGRDLPGLMRLRSAMLARGATRDAAEVVRRTFLPYSDRDQAQLERPEVLDHLARDYAEAFRQGGKRSADEMVAYARPWPLPADLPAPALLWTCEDDAIVVPRTTEYVAERLPHAELRRVPEAGHLWFLDHGADVFRELAERGQS